MRVRSRQFSAPSAVAAHTVSSKPPLRSTAPQGRAEAGITDDNRQSVPAGVNGRGCAASLRGPVGAARYATISIIGTHHSGQVRTQRQNLNRLVENLKLK
jgi:hypothetical protein